MIKKYDYSEEKIKFLKDNVKGISLQELTNKFNKEFNTDLPTKVISNMKRYLNLTSGIDTKFKKGQVSWNKGKKMTQEQYEKCKKTMFQKGNITYNTRAIGTERIDVDGYTYIKIAEPNKWKLKHRVLWEKENGLIPKGYNLIFADGNKQNLDLDNLVLVSNSELFIMNRNGLYKKNKELTKTGSVIAKVIDKTNKSYKMVREEINK